VFINEPAVYVVPFTVTYAPVGVGVEELESFFLQAKIINV
jgi:hypothetical protein